MLTPSSQYGLPAPRPCKNSGQFLNGNLITNSHQANNPAPLLASVHGSQVSDTEGVAVLGCRKTIIWLDQNQISLFMHSRVQLTILQEALKIRSYPTLSGI